MLILGGIVMLWIDKKFASQMVQEEEIVNEDEDGNEIVVYPPLPTYKQAFIIGLSQCIAMIPGVSRSAATIIGGLTQKMTFKNAAEFSFFLAVPTISAAALYKTYAGFKSITGTHVTQLVYGNITSFIVALIAIQFFLGVLNKYGLRFFGYYRIILGLVILIGIYVFHLPLEIMK
jgi:undecaprenyl-diphosphatase